LCPLFFSLLDFPVKLMLVLIFSDVYQHLVGDFPVIRITGNFSQVGDGKQNGRAAILSRMATKRMPQALGNLGHA